MMLNMRWTSAIWTEAWACSPEDGVGGGDGDGGGGGDGDGDGDGDVLLKR